MTRGQLLLGLEVGFDRCRRVQVCAVGLAPIGLCGSVGQARTGSGVVATAGEPHSDLGVRDGFCRLKNLGDGLE